MKNAKPSDSTVETSTDRSRYLLPRSHEVSGRNRQAWQAAPCSVRPSLIGWCSAQSGSEAQSRMLSKAWSRCRPNAFGSPKADQPAERPLAVRGGGVEQDAGHRLRGRRPEAGNRCVPGCWPSCSRTPGRTAGSGRGPASASSTYRIVGIAVVRLQAPVLPPAPVGLEELGLHAPRSS